MTDLDITTFNTPNGYVTTDFDTIITPNSSSKGKVIVLQPDGKIVMAGKFFDSTISPSPGIEIVAVCRYLSNGTLDLGFGTAGKVTQLLGAGFPNNISIDEVTGITLQSDLSIVICGYQTFPGLPGTTNIFVLRLTPAGVLDINFNSAASLPALPGYLYTTPAEFTSVFSPTYGSTNCSVEAIAMQTIGASEFIVIGGSAAMYLSATPSIVIPYYALARYTLLGVLEPTFGSSGLVIQSFNPPISIGQFGIDLYVTSTQILLAGVKYYTPPVNTTSRMTVVKFNGGGILDSTWGTNGNGLTDIPNFFVSSQDTANAIQVQTDGKIILGGTSTNNISPQQRCFVLSRLLSTGLIDTSYGTGGTGVVITDLSPPSSPSYNLYGNTMVIQPDDKIVLGGSFDTLGATPASFALARYLTTGSLDTTFGLAGTGLVLEDIIPSNPSYVEEGFSLAIQPDGKILLGGTFQNNRQFSFILARYFGFPPYPPPTPIVPICFPAGTPVTTDQGEINIELIDPDVHTIFNKKIVAITETIMLENNIVCFEKNSLGYNIPNKKTYISNYHGIIHNGKLIQANKFVGRLPGVYYKKYNNEILYNVLMEKHYIIKINNMRVETLNPLNFVAQLYTKNYTPEEKTNLILEMNKKTAEFAHIKYNTNHIHNIHYTKRNHNQKIIPNYFITQLHSKTIKNYHMVKSINTAKPFIKLRSNTISHKPVIVKNIHHLSRSNKRLRR
jgi:uncharacterized delta-60 repeat protein